MIVNRRRFLQLLGASALTPFVAPAPTFQTVAAWDTATISPTVIAVMHPGHGLAAGDLIRWSTVDSPMRWVEDGELGRTEGMSIVFEKPDAVSIGEWLLYRKDLARGPKYSSGQVRGWMAQ